MRTDTSPLTLIGPNQPLLREKASAARKLAKSDRLLIQRMIETLKAHNRLGLAAPQVGVPKRIIVVRIPSGFNRTKRSSC